MEPRIPSPSAPRPRNPRVAPWLRRVIAVGVGAAAFLGIASVIDPAGSSARQPEAARLPSRADRFDRTPRDTAKPIGELLGREHRILIHSSTQGPLYTVIQLSDGRVLASRLPLDEVYRMFPEIGIENLEADDGTGSSEQATPIMLAEPREAPR